MSVAVILGIIIIVLALAWLAINVLAGANLPTGGGDQVAGALVPTAVAIVIGLLMISSHWWYHYLNMHW